VDGFRVLQALKVLRTAEYAPFVVFIAAPTGLLVNSVSSVVTVLQSQFMRDA